MRSTGGERDYRTIGKRNSKTRKRQGMSLEDRPILEANAAGVDVGAREMFVSVPPDRDPNPVQVFDTFTTDLHRLVDWLVQCRVTTVAMESTGVYWIPLYDIVEQRGLKACLVNAKHMKNVPGRRTDWHECQWLQYLHSVGLLRAAFRPESEICAVRSLMRHRSELVKMAAQHVQHMQKAMTQMNLQLQHVINDITGKTGLAIIDAILAGQHNPTELAKLRDPRIKADSATVEKSLIGNWRSEHLFTLKQSRELYESYQKQILECDKEIDRLVRRFQSRVDPSEKPLPPDEKAKHSRNKAMKNKLNLEARLEFRTEVYKLFGIDVTQIPGIDSTAFQLFAEVGRDMSKWPTAGHFASWLGLCPDNDISGGRIWRGARHAKTRAGQLFRFAAYALHRNSSPLGDYLRRKKAQLGAPAATTATAHKIAVIFYTMVKNQVEYDATIWATRDLQRQKRLESKLKRQARQLGYNLVTADPQTT